MVKPYYATPGDGIFHFYFPEQGLVMPGQFIPGADSHSRAYGAYGSVGIGVGSTTLGFGWATGYVYFTLARPRRVVLSGELQPWVTGKDIVLKLLYGSAFKAPSPYLLYASPLRPGDVVGNTNLKPQFVHTLEFQYSYKPNPFFGLTTGMAGSWLMDKAEFTPQGINQAARNVADQRSLSWEKDAIRLGIYVERQ